MDFDQELLTKVCEVKDFFGSVFFRDTLDDWNPAKDLGEFLLRVGPEVEVMGHALLAKAHRHLGNLELARDELRRCEVAVSNAEVAAGEVDMFARLVAQEEKFLNG